MRRQYKYEGQSPLSEVYRHRYVAGEQIQAGDVVAAAPSITVEGETRPLAVRVTVPIRTPEQAALRVIADAAGRFLADGAEASPEVRRELLARLATAEGLARDVLESAATKPASQEFLDGLLGGLTQPRTNADDLPCPKCGGDRLRTNFAGGPYCHATLRHPEGS